MKILRKPKIEDIVCNIQNNEEDKEAFIVQYQPFIRKSISSVCADILQNRMMNIALDCLHLTKQLNSIPIQKENPFSVC